VGKETQEKEAITTEAHKKKRKNIEKKRTSEKEKTQNLRETQ
jgi:hypothetical protein